MNNYIRFKLCSKAKGPSYPFLLMKGIALTLACCLLFPVGALCYTDLAIKTAKEIAYEATLPSIGPLGYPLPLAASWNTGEYAPSYAGWTPDYQLGLIEGGHHILPSFVHPSSRNTGWQTSDKYNSYYSTAIGKCKDLSLPISWVGIQWEYPLSSDAAYTTLPAATNPNCVKPDGTVLAKVSPFGQSSHWQAVGSEMTKNTTIAAAQAQYPNPPRVYWLSNNEHSRLEWTKADTDDSKYLSLYGTGQTEAFKKQVIGDAFIPLFRAVQAGMKAHLTTTWSGASRFIGYEASQDRSFGRYEGWRVYSLEKPNRISPWPSAWDGTSVSYYTDNWSAQTDYQEMSPQIEGMNWVFQKVEALSTNPEYVFEMSVWDGDRLTWQSDDAAHSKRRYYESLGQTYTPERYKGWLQFGMWVNRPRVVREFRDHLETLTNQGTYWLALVDAVDKIYSNATLKRFWRFGSLVENGTYPHPYQQSIPAEYKSVPRNFFLNTNLDPPHPWVYGSFYIHIDVFSMALSIGATPTREWLVYTHAPIATKENVQITLPGFGTITVNSTPGGSFYHVAEIDKKVTPVRTDVSTAISPVTGLTAINTGT